MSPSVVRLGRLVSILAAGTLLTALVLGIAQGQKPPTAAEISDIGAFVIILDCSGSMEKSLVGGKEVPDPAKWKAAQDGALALVESIPLGKDLAFIVYGSDTTIKNEKQSCQDVQVLRALGPLDPESKANLKKTIAALRPYGMTPIALALQTAGQELTKTGELSKVILITDGLETCGGDPVKEAEALVKNHKSLEGGVDVVGYQLTDKEKGEVEKIADKGKGTYHNANTVKALTDSIKVIQDKIAKSGPYPQGQPEIMELGQSQRWYVWRDGAGWHLRTTTSNQQHKFGGTIRVVGGDVTSVDSANLPGGQKKDWWSLSEENKVLKLELNSKVGMEGLDFKVSDKANQVVFTLKIDDKEQPDLIFVGRHGAHPSAATFVLPAHWALPRGASWLFDGKDLSAWEGVKGGKAPWTVKDGYMECNPGKGNIVTKEKFGPDFNLFLEFWLPLMKDEKGQQRANSGVFLQGRHEVQILDSYKNETPLDRSVGALFDLLAPNKEVQKKAIKPPEQWNSCYITFRAPGVTAGKVTKKGYVKVEMNGVVITEGEFDRTTPEPLDDKLGAPGPLMLQENGSKVRFRKIWIKPLDR